MGKENKLSLIKEIGSRKYGTQGKCMKWGLFMCTCGREKEATLSNVRLGRTSSCDVCVREMLSKSKIKNGLTKHPLRGAWNAMRTRCTNKNHETYSGYGGKGIFICDEWNSFEVFLKWATENGYENGLQIDRIDNNDGYYPENCRFVTPAKNTEIGRRCQKSNNTSGFNGVDFYGKKHSNQWQARIKGKYIGYFETIEEAVEARITKEIELFGEQRTNFHYNKEE